MSLATSAARRFPQPVRVGDLLRRNVLRPLESRDLLGRVDDIVSSDDGGINVVVDYGGFLGWFTRRIAIPLDAMVLVGQDMAVIDLTPAQLNEFKTYGGASGRALPRDDMIKVGLGRPSH